MRCTVLPPLSVFITLNKLEGAGLFNTLLYHIPPLAYFPLFFCRHPKGACRSLVFTPKVAFFFVRRTNNGVALKERTQ